MPSGRRLGARASPLYGWSRVADHPVETDSGEPVLALELVAGLGERARCRRRAGAPNRRTRRSGRPVRMLMAWRRWPCANSSGARPSTSAAPPSIASEHLLVGHRCWHLGLVQQPMGRAVEDRVVDEVARRGVAALGDELAQTSACPGHAGRSSSPSGHRSSTTGRSTGSCRTPSPRRGRVHPGRVGQRHQLRRAASRRAGRRARRG